MIYSSLPFIFFVLTCVLIFYLAPVKMRTWVLLIFSCLWYGSWDHKWLWIFVVLLSVNYFTLNWMSKESSRNPVPWLLMLNGGFFILSKTIYHYLLPESTPYAVSFIVFILLAMIFDYQRSKAKDLVKWHEFLLLPLFFPLLMGGPIERAGGFYKELRKEEKIKMTSLLDGLLIFSMGFFKVAYPVSLTSWFILNNDSFVPGPLSWLTLGFLGTLKTYFIFSGFCDMGRGAARLFDIELSISFRPFYFAAHPNDFWQRWNISLGTWIRDYISFPLMFKFGRKIHQNYILIASFFIVGIWHGVSLKWVFFGLFNGVVITTYNLLRNKIKSKFFGRIFAFVIIIGNGLILREVTDSVFTESFFLPEWFHYFVTSLILLGDVIQEYQNKVDWYLDIPIWGKITLGVLIVAGFHFAFDYSLQAHGPMTEMVPEYFKL